MANLKKAPQKEILSIDRTGSWGKVEYRHRLACGHTEVRKRPSVAPKIACSWCVVAEEKQKELESLSVLETLPLEVPLEEPFYDADAEHEVDAGRLRAGLVLALGLAPEAVEVVSEVGDDGELEARYVVVFMDLSTARRIARLDSDTPT
jgi:hypothetical protein